MRIPQLRPSDLEGRAGGLPLEPFLVAPALYRVVDGDTIAIRHPGPPPKDAFRIRHNTINAPERAPREVTDSALAKIGIQPAAHHPGELAREKLKAICAGRMLYIEPRGRDGFGRLLADITVSGAPGPRFQVTGASSTEHLMVASGLVDWRRNIKSYPDLLPQHLAQLLASGPALRAGEDRDNRYFFP